ncbi:MAG: VTT domain-containing protein [Gemmatimonadetes bacterium]|nr:VTT domain-containing protein [Gemmatimonadota bacterium]
MQTREADAATARRRKLALWVAVIVLIVTGGALLLQRVPDSVSAPLFVLIVIIEVVIAPIPGGAVGYMGAARYGFWNAWPLLYIGNVIGTTIAFALARRLGTPIFEDNVAPRTRARYDQVLGGHPVILWLVYAVPLLPIDVLSVLAGLSKMAAWRFLLTAWTAYAVYTGIVAYAGSFLAENLGVAQAVSAIGIVLFVGLGAWLWRATRPRPKV